MKQCEVCGHPRREHALKCPECGKFYSKITEIIAEHEAEEERQSFRGRCTRILESGDIRHALQGELKILWEGLTKKGVFALFVIFVFVFALVVSVL